jgi:hypothetical protein
MMPKTYEEEIEEVIKSLTPQEEDAPVEIRDPGQIQKETLEALEDDGVTTVTVGKKTYDLTDPKQAKQALLAQQKEATESGLKEKDYRQKTMELAEERKQAAADRKAAQDAIKQAMDMIKSGASTKAERAEAIENLIEINDPMLDPKTQDAINAMAKELGATRAQLRSMNEKEEKSKADETKKTQWNKTLDEQAQKTWDELPPESQATITVEQIRKDLQESIDSQDDDAFKGLRGLLKTKYAPNKSTTKPKEEPIEAMPKGHAVSAPTQAKARSKLAAMTPAEHKSMGVNDPIGYMALQAASIGMEV